MSDWMKENTVSDIQTAIQSSTIQTALERNVSDLSPQALQSFLTQAPIPRMFYDTNSATYLSGTNTTCTWQVSTTTHDPYNMMVPSSGIFTIPVDGYYSGYWWMGCVGGASSAIDVGWMDPAKTTFYTHTVIPFDPASASVYIGTLPILRPFKAGTPLIINIGNSTVGSLISITTTLGLVWVAPFNNYQSGGQ